MKSVRASFSFPMARRGLWLPAVFLALTGASGAETPPRAVRASEAFDWPPVLAREWGNPVIEWGAVELGAPDIVTLAPVAVDADGYAESTFQVPNLPQLRGQVLWSQAFGVTAAGKLQMTPPERITLR